MNNKSTNAKSYTFLQWNNRGADLMQRRRYVEAFTCFSRALTILQSQIKKSKSTAPEARSPVSSDIRAIARHICITAPATKKAEAETKAVPQIARDTVVCASQPQHEKPSSTRCDDSISDQNITDDDVPFLYNHAVRFSPEMHEIEKLPLRPLSVIMVINMALARHQQALEETNDDKQKAFMKQAISLYEMALKGKSQELCLQPLGMDGFQLILACYNNLGYAQQTLEFSNRASVCFESLLSLLMWAVVYDMKASAPHLEGYWNSVQHLLFQYPTSISAGAA